MIPQTDGSNDQMPGTPVAWNRPFWETIVVHLRAMPQCHFGSGLIPGFFSVAVTDTPDGLRGVHHIRSWLFLSINAHIDRKR